MVAKKRKADFSDVKDGGNFKPRHRAEGDYKMKIIGIEDSTSNAGNEQTVFTIVVASEAKNARPATYPYYCGWESNQLWKIRKLFIAAGMDVPKKLVLVDPNKLMNKTIGAALIDDEYEGNLRSRIDDVFPVDDIQGNVPDDEDDVDEVDDEDEAPAPRKRRAPEPDDEDDDDEPAPPRRRAAAKTTRRRAPEPEDDDDDDDEPPAPRRRPAKKTAARRRQDEDDDDDMDIDDL